MEVLLLGNGFDLHYCLPTEYRDFIRTMERLCIRIENGEKIESIAQVFNDAELIRVRGIRACREQYGDLFDASYDSAVFRNLARKAKDNLWFSYLASALKLNKDWIDFEREIGDVIDSFAVFFDGLVVNGDMTGSFNYSEDPRKVHAWNVCAKFPFFYMSENIDEDEEEVVFLPKGIYEKYILEEPVSSGNYAINKAEIVEELFKSLKELSEVLEEYLLRFVDAPLQNLQGKLHFEDKALVSMDWSFTQVVSFNYSHTVETLLKCKINQVCHIHGELDGNGIVLGVNANETDEIEKMDLTFLHFKKYFQRVLYGTDSSYLAFLDVLEKDLSKRNYHLTVIGHSLDITDKEVIQDCFNYASDIRIYYHSIDKIAQYINNLVAIFGKKGFDSLRLKKHLVFVQLDSIEIKTI